MKKVLFIANHAGFSKFNVPYFQWFKNQGWEVHNISPGLEVGSVDKQFNVQICRNPWSITNLKAYYKIKKICHLEHYDLIHCHTPVGGVLGRLCGHIYKDTKVIYTAHGFHFFKGASFINWIIYYPIEKILAKKTDCIVTINSEDYEIAKKKFKSVVRMIPGVGVDVSRFSPFSCKIEKYDTRLEFGLAKDDFVMVYCAQFIKRKNHKYILDIVSYLNKSIPCLKIIFVGSGPLMSKLQSVCKEKKIENFVIFLGYRQDVERIYKISDLIISTSYQEGFGISLVEGMACGLPVVCSDIRGHNEIINGINGFRVALSDKKSFIDKIQLLYCNKKLREEISVRNISYARNFSRETSVAQMAKIYKEFM